MQMIFVARVREKKETIHFCSSSTKISALGTTLAKEYSMPTPEAGTQAYCESSATSSHQSERFTCAAKQEDERHRDGAYVAPDQVASVQLMSPMPTMFSVIRLLRRWLHVPRRCHR